MPIAHRLHHGPLARPSTLQRGFRVGGRSWALLCRLLLGAHAVDVPRRDGQHWLDVHTRHLDGDGEKPSVGTHLSCSTWCGFASNCCDSHTYGVLPGPTLVTHAPTS